MAEGADGPVGWAKAGSALEAASVPAESLGVALSPVEPDDPDEADGAAAPEAAPEAAVPEPEVPTLPSKEATRGPGGTNSPEKAAGFQMSISLKSCSKSW